MEDDKAIFKRTFEILESQTKKELGLLKEAFITFKATSSLMLATTWIRPSVLLKRSGFIQWLAN